MSNKVFEKIGGSFAPPLDLRYCIGLLETLGADATRVAKAFAGHKLNNPPPDFSAALCHRCQNVCEEFSHAVGGLLATAPATVRAAIGGTPK